MRNNDQGKKTKKQCMRGPLLLAAALLLPWTGACSFAASPVFDEAGETASVHNEPDPLDESLHETEEKIVFTDDLGREISLESPRRVAAMIGSFADMWILAGGRDTLAAAAHDAWTSFDLGLDESVTDLGEIKNPSLETLLASQPDLVLASAKNDSNKDLQTTLENAGIPVAYFDVSSFDDYLHMLEILTTLTGDADAYQKNGLDLQERIQSVISQSEKHAPETVLYLRAAGSAVKAKNSEGTVLGEMLKDLHAVNIADSQNGLLEDLSLEAILEANPDRIFIVYQGSDDAKARAVMEETLTSSPAWSTLDAVKNGKVEVMDQTLYNLKPNARWAEAYEQLYGILYGDPDA